MGNPATRYLRAANSHRSEKEQEVSETSPVTSSDKDRVVKVVLDDGGDGSVSAEIEFEDGTKFLVNGDPCRCWDYGERDTDAEPDEWGDYPIIHHCTPAYVKGKD